MGLLALSAVLSGLAHPPVSAAWLILIAPAPLFALVVHTRPRTGFAYGWLWSFIYYLTLGHPLIYLIHLQTGSVALGVVGLVLVAGVGALFGGLFGLLASLMPRNALGVVGAAGAWAFTQYLRGLGPYAFVWGHWGWHCTKCPSCCNLPSWLGRGGGVPDCVVVRAARVWLLVMASARVAWAGVAGERARAVWVGDVDIWHGADGSMAAC